MTVPEAFSDEKLLKIFESRGMEIHEEDIDKIKHINYYKLKEFAHPLSKITKQDGVVTISYDGVKFNDVLRRYYQDKNLRIYLLHAIEKIEISIKTILSHQLGLKYGAFGYLNFFLWANREKFTRFQIEEKQHLIKHNILKNMKRKKCAEYAIDGNLNRDGFPTVWLAIDVLTFGDIVILLELLNKKILIKIADEYKITMVELISWMKCIRFIRNLCAHNSNLIDSKLTTKPKVRKGWNNYLYFIGSKNGEARTPTNRLATVICILIYLVKAINPKYKFENIRRSIVCLCHNDEKMAQLLGFCSIDEAKNIIKRLSVS